MVAHPSHHLQFDVINCYINYIKLTAVTGVLLHEVLSTEKGKDLQK